MNNLDNKRSHSSQNSVDRYILSKYMYKGQQTNCSNSFSKSKTLQARLGWAGLGLRQSQAKFLVLSRSIPCLSTVFHCVKRQHRLGLSLSTRYIKSATTCVGLIKIRLGDFVCEIGSDHQTALGLSNPGFPLSCF